MPRATQQKKSEPDVQTRSLERLFGCFDGPTNDKGQATSQFYKEDVNTKAAASFHFLW